MEHLMNPSNLSPSGPVKEVYDVHAPEYDKVSSCPQSIGLTHPLVFSMVGDVAGKSILDLACGTGLYLKAFSEAGAKESVGVDISDGMIEAARRRVGSKATLLVSDMASHELPSVLRGRKFDIVMSAWGLYHMETDAQLSSALSNAYTLLADDGVAYFVLGEDKATLNGIDRLIGVEILEVVRGDWSGTTCVKKALAGEVVVLDVCRPYPVLEAACRKAGFRRVEKINQVFDEAGLKVWSAEDWEKIKSVKPVFAIACYK
jgi:ubiquinone/menaquinone biosynthesis C-methylase UbiE